MWNWHVLNCVHSFMCSSTTLSGLWYTVRVVVYWAQPYTHCLHSALEQFGTADALTDKFFLDGAKKLENLEVTHIDRGKTYETTYSYLSSGSNQGPKT